MNLLLKSMERAIIAEAMRIMAELAGISTARDMKRPPSPETRPKSEERRNICLRLRAIMWAARAGRRTRASTSKRPDEPHRHRDGDAEDKNNEVVDEPCGKTHGEGNLPVVEDGLDLLEEEEDDKDDHETRRNDERKVPDAQGEDIAPEDAEGLEDVDLSPGEEDEREREGKGHKETREGSETHFRFLRQGSEGERREGAEEEAEEHGIETEKKADRAAEKGDMHHGEP